MTSSLAVVTGAASGIGRSIAAHFLGEGLRVVGLDIRLPSSFDTDRWTGLYFDVSNEADWANVMGHVVAGLGAPDVLVNAAGISPRKEESPRSQKSWAEILRTNLVSCWLGMRVVLPHMIARRSGTIVNIGALAAQQPLSVGGYAGVWLRAHQKTIRGPRGRLGWPICKRLKRTDRSGPATKPNPISTARVDEHLSSIRDLERAIAGLPPDARVDPPDFDGDMKDWSWMCGSCLQQATRSKHARTASAGRSKPPAPLLLLPGRAPKEGK